jgi:hypothetical protein
MLLIRVCNQAPGESIDSFKSELKKTAEISDFETFKHRLITDPHLWT